MKTRGAGGHRVFHHGCAADAALGPPEAATSRSYAGNGSRLRPAPTGCPPVLPITSGHPFPGSAELEAFIAVHVTLGWSEMSARVHPPAAYGRADHVARTGRAQGRV